MCTDLQSLSDRFLMNITHICRTRDRAIKNESNTQTSRILEWIQQREGDHSAVWLCAGLYKNNSAHLFPSPYLITLQILSLQVLISFPFDNPDLMLPLPHSEAVHPRSKTLRTLKPILLSSGNGNNIFSSIPLWLHPQTHHLYHIEGQGWQIHGNTTTTWRFPSKSLTILTWKHSSWVKIL